MSLLSPLGHQSFPFDDDGGEGEDEDDVDPDAHDSEAKVASLRGMELQGCSSGAESENNQEEKQTGLPEGSLTPWEVWFVGKEKEERDRLQQKAQEELNQQLEKRKEVEEREKRKVMAEEKHKEWVQQENETGKEGGGRREMLWGEKRKGRREEAQSWDQG